MLRKLLERLFRRSRANNHRSSQSMRHYSNGINQNVTQVLERNWKLLLLIGSSVLSASFFFLRGRMQAELAFHHEAKQVLEDKHYDDGIEREMDNFKSTKKENGGKIRQADDIGTAPHRAVGGYDKVFSRQKDAFNTVKGNQESDTATSVDLLLSGVTNSGP